MMRSGIINAPRHHVKMLGYTLSRGEIGGIECIWYDKGVVSFDSPHIETGSFISLLGLAAIVWIAFLILMFLGSFGLLVDTIFMVWAVNIWFKLLWV